jgi:hypothetical protein
MRQLSILARAFEREEIIGFEAFIAEFAIEAFNVGVLGRLARLDEV